MANIMRIGGGGGEPNILTVAVDTGAIVTATNGSKTVAATSVNGNAILKLSDAGTWNLVATKDGQTAEDSIVIVDEYPVEVSFGLPLSSLAEGALVQINENGSPVPFYLAKHDYESGLNGAGRTLVVRKDCYDQRQWHTSNVNAYATSAIDSWLNGTYKNLLDPSVQAMIGTTKFYYTPGNGNTTKTTLTRSVFLLSATELGQTHSYLNAEGTALDTAVINLLKIAKLNGSAVTQWTRSPTSPYTSNAWRLNSDGSLGNNHCSNTYGSRPAFTLPSTAMVSGSPNADGSYTLLT